MRQRIRQARTNDEGFTLIELLIVIVVLGILSGITVFGVATFRGDSVTAACKADIKMVSVAAEAFNARTGAYPGTIADLTTAKYLKAAPSSTEYAITLASGGVVTGTKGTPAVAC